MFDIITFGSATQDIVVKPRPFLVPPGKKKSPDVKEIHFPVGSKIELEEMKFFSGGGGTNTAAAFALQGLKTAFVGVIGSDEASGGIINEMEKFGVDTRFVIKTNGRANHAIVILSERHERTILVYRGAEKEATFERIPLDNLKSQWFYLAPLSGLMCDSFEDIINFAQTHKIKIAVNPGKEQLSLPKSVFNRALQCADILFVNQEEASFLTGIPFSKEKEIFQKIDDLCPGIAVMTKGKEGAVASDGKNIYSARPLETVVMDTTGAGDSFGAGFVAEYMRSCSIEKAMQFGMANAAACLSQMGAKNGLLKKGQEFKRTQVNKEKI